VSSLEIRSFQHPGINPGDLRGVVALYNRALNGRHGFFPITEALFADRILSSPWFEEELCQLALVDNRVAGIIHGADLRDPCYEEGGAIELLTVDPEFHHQGIESMLLETLILRMKRRNLFMIDAGGTFPLTPFYSTLMDGSERSGFFTDEVELIQLLQGHGFTERRRSLVMRADLFALGDAPADLPRPQEVHLRLTERTPEATWLDHVFRDWPLQDSHLIETESGRLLSRAIISPMTALSQEEGHCVYALFGVNTPPSLRGRGYGSKHLRLLQNLLRQQGVDLLELHVYADNEPAIRLYRRCGFIELAQTLTLRKML
jgi:ribosomal protein S18 acetylase RimI-like enzyme